MATEPSKEFLHQAEIDLDGGILVASRFCMIWLHYLEGFGIRHGVKADIQVWSALLIGRRCWGTSIHREWKRSSPMANIWNSLEAFLETDKLFP